MKKLIINPGDKFGRLTIIKEVEPKGNYRYFQCECECGTIREFKIYRLTNGKTVSCGCYGKELAKTIGKNTFDKYRDLNCWKTGNVPFNYVDGDNSKIHKSENYYLTRLWQGIKQRCYNPNERAYKWYGERGIKVYEPWINDYQLFKKWILENLHHRPEGMSLDRINNDGNYEPGNLRWADKQTQMNNRRKK